MSIDFCNLCNDPCIKNASIGNNAMQEIWRAAIAQAICNIYQAVAAPVVTLPELSIGFATLQSSYGSYATVSFLNGQTKLKRLRVLNTVDAAIEISFDGGVTTFLSVLASTDTGFLDLGNIVVADPADMFIRRVSGDSATSGTLYFQGSY